MRNARIISAGAYAPAKVLSNAWFDDYLGIDVSTWLEESAQIFERRWINEGESTSTLAKEASLTCLERAGIEAGELDLIIVATDTPDYPSPATATVLQHILGADKAAAFDVNAACAGFVTALDMAAKYIRSDTTYNKVLVVGAYAMSRHLNPDDKKTVTLFADGAGAILLSAEETPAGYQTAQLLSHGQYWDYMGVYAGGSVRPVDEAARAENAHNLVFAKRFPSTVNPEFWSGMAFELCRRLDIRPDEVDKYFITQININAINATLDLLGLPHDKAHNVMHYYGYTGSACIPMAFNEAWEKELIKRGDQLFFLSSGGGLAFSSAAFIL